MAASERVNFDHTACYRDDVHENSKAGRHWRRREGPASRSGRVYAVRNEPTVDAAPANRAPQQHAEAHERRASAAPRYRPATIKLLLVAEAPPSALDRYFYFHDVDTHDSLFRHVARSILHVEPTRANKAELLEQLKDRGVFLIDLKEDPVDGTPLTNHVPGLLERIRRLHPEMIILIKATVHDAAYRALVEAGLPVVPERVPFPGSGQQRRFEEAFGRALDKSR